MFNESQFRLQGKPQRMRLQRRPKTPQIKQIYGCVDIYKDIGNKNTVSNLLQSTEFVKTRLDKLSTVVVEVASFVGNPVGLTFF